MFSNNLQLQICAPCRNGDHYYCVVNAKYGLIRLYDLKNNFESFKTESCSCVCDKKIGLPNHIVKQ